MASQPKSGNASSDSKESKYFDMVKRGVKKQNTPGTLTFVGLRAADPVLQWTILARGVGSSLLHKLGLETLPAGPPNTGTFLDAIDLSPYRLVLLAMTLGDVSKQIFWKTYIAKEEFPPSTTAAIASAGAFFNSANNLLFTATATSASLSGSGRFPQTPLLVGSGLYILGMGLELGSELQRKRFKDDPRNKGHPCTEGLWAISRHINYAGWMIWRTGFAIAAAGWGWGIFTVALTGMIFSQGSIPALDAYCSKTYGAEWEEFKRKTPYKLIPYVY